MNIENLKNLLRCPPSRKYWKVYLKRKEKFSVKPLMMWEMAIF
jgi:hypothetical protein